MWQRIEHPDFGRATRGIEVFIAVDGLMYVAAHWGMRGELHVVPASEVTILF